MSIPPTICSTEIAEVLEIYVTHFTDERGFFSEAYNQGSWAYAGFKETFVQDNLSLSQRGVLRGLHYQLIPHGMGKLIRVLTGAIFDVIVDLRRGSPTYGKWVGRTLTESSPIWLWAPIGFAHGFLSLEDNTRVYYKCSGMYNASAERAIRYNDPQLAISWPGDITIISEKDRHAPLFAESEHNFVYP